ncbi:MAG: carbohydrate ABC transporter permease, partial [Clostridiales bacterium]|nr:carbohydrate ABC transporter permease [Clostridiales bacterium]
TMMLPGQVTMIPTYVMFSNLGWVNTHLPLVVPAFLGGSAYHIFLMRQFFSSIPTSLDDAAKIDGVGFFGLFWRIILPSSRAVLLTVAVFTFVSRWNDFMGPLIYLNSVGTYTLALGLNFFKNQYVNYWNLTMAYNVLTILPVIVVFFLAQKYFIQGIVITGEKG